MVHFAGIPKEEARGADDMAEEGACLGEDMGLFGGLRYPGAVAVGAVEIVGQLIKGESPLTVTTSALAHGFNVLPGWG